MSTAVIMAHATTSTRRRTVNDLLDYFIPKDLLSNAETHRRARMFMLSHIFGPMLGSTIPVYLMATGISRDIHAFVFFASIVLFWAWPFALRYWKRYQLLSFLSVQNLIFCVLWACYSYGGVCAAFVPWMLIFPLLAFLYLPPVGWIRNVLLLQIFGSVTVFVAISFTSDELPHTELSRFQVIGMISMASVAAYFAMMSLYFAKSYQEQREFTREINSLVSTSDNLLDLTDAANQARAAKADFVAGMSHELRTPLNAIIGYSQLLLEEACGEKDHEVVDDISHIHKSGSDLLRLIDDILTFSRIDAGKMPITLTVDSAGSRLAALMASSALAEALERYVVVTEGNGLDQAIRTDWHIVGSTLSHVIDGLQRQHGTGRLTIVVEGGPTGELGFRLIDADACGIVRAIAVMRELFEHGDDASSSKYGHTGIETALACRLAQLVSASLDAVIFDDGRPGALLWVPDQSEPALLAA